jgi:GMP synthase-like glutamine amidotransferase
MQRVLIVTHLDDRHPGLAREALERAGCPVVEVNSDDRPEWDPDQIAGIISLGGEQSATAVDDDPFLAAEVALMRDAIQRETPVLGMCLGAQLLAVAAGGQVTRAERLIVGWPELSPLPSALEDPLFGTLPTGLPVLKWHEDIIAPPDGATPLATTEDPGATLFRVGSSAWGSQAHLEATPSLLIDCWTASQDGAAQIEAAGYELDAFRAYSRERLEAQMAAARPIFTRFGELVRARGG